MVTNAASMRLVEDFASATWTLQAKCGTFLGIALSMIAQDRASQRNFFPRLVASLTLEQGRETALQVVNCVEKLDDARGIDTDVNGLQI